MKQQHPVPDTPAESASTTFSRRQFIAGAVAAAAFTIIKPELVRGTAANSKIEAGIIAQGQRGRRIARAMVDHGGYQITAVGDYFPEVALDGGSRLGLAPEKCFSGLMGYQRVIESGVDAVILEAPPYAFPEQCAAAVAAGRHVYMAKPIACDVPGCLAVQEAARQASAKNLVFHADFQIRTDPFWVEAVRQVREGLIGPLSMLCTQYTGDSFEDPPLTATIESRLKNLVWCNDQALGGGHLVNAAVHVIDAALWVAGDRPPVSAMGVARQNRPAPHGDSPDTWAIVYEFDGGLVFNHRGEHLPNQVGDGNYCGLTAYGQTGTMFGAYEGKTWIHGNKGGYRGGLVQNLAQTGLLANLTVFHSCVTQGKHDNPTMPAAINSTLTAILGREAGAAGGRVTCKEMMQANRRLEVNLAGLVR